LSKLALHQIRSLAVTESIPRPLDHDTLKAALTQLAALDPDLDRIIRRYGPPPLWTREPEFATLIQIILEQQISLKAAQTVYQRLCNSLGEMSPQAILETGEAGLRDRGLTRQKSRYCHELAKHVTDGRLVLEQLKHLPAEEGRKALLAVPGLGAWSVDVYYMMALRHPDIWPQGDLALAVAMQEIKGLEATPKRDEQAQIAGHWAPWRSVAARLLWLHYLAERGQLPTV
jgi:DNA-3-methyladenine glycosylase II